MHARDAAAWYFAYGSNADAERLVARVGAIRESRPARLNGWELAFSARVRSEGGGGAIVVPATGAVVHGVAYLLDASQLATLDRLEFDASRDLHGAGRRIDAPVTTPAGSVDATLYTIDQGGPHLAPSERYLRHILEGLAAAGHPEAVLSGVRAAADREGGRAG